MGTIVKLAATDTEISKMLKGSLILQAEQNDHKRTSLRLFTAMQHLAEYIRDVESKWDSDEHFERVEDAVRYLDAAKYMRDMGRKEDRIEAIEAWVNKARAFPWEH